MKFSIAHSTKCPLSLLGNLTKSPGLKPYQQKPKAPVRKDAPRTSAKIIKKGHENLTLHDWIVEVA